jgi:hemerythrin
MALILWDSTLETGNPRIDADHRELARLFNLLPEAVEKRRGKEFSSDVLGQIIRHAEAHFQLEQELMAEHRYPKIEQHTAEHVMLLGQARSYKAGFDAGATESEVALIDFPEVWLGFHILFSDKDLARFLAQVR